MTENNYTSATTNMSYGINLFIKNEYFKTIIPPQIVKTLECIYAYILCSRELLFSNGKLKSLSLLNIIVWWKFIKWSRQFVLDMITIWKE